MTDLKWRVMQLCNVSLSVCVQLVKTDLKWRVMQLGNVSLSVCVQLVKTEFEVACDAATQCQPVCFQH